MDVAPAGADHNSSVDGYRNALSSYGARLPVDLSPCRDHHGRRALYLCQGSARLLAAGLFDFSRNHYDRLGHFDQGFVSVIMVGEVQLRISSLRPG